MSESAYLAREAASARAAIGRTVGEMKAVARRAVPPNGAKFIFAAGATVLLGAAIVGIVARRSKQRCNAEQRQRPGILGRVASGAYRLIRDAALGAVASAVLASVPSRGMDGETDAQGSEPPLP